MKKAIERKARKLKAKGITVDLEALRADYIAQHRGQGFNSSESEQEEDLIDVVGIPDDDVDDNEDMGDCSIHSARDASNNQDTIDAKQYFSKTNFKSNKFSIDALLFNIS